jgi:serine/threonine protein kinase
LKPLNIFISVYGDVKIGDFGHAKQLMKGISKADSINRGTVAYNSPELIREEQHRISTDIWSLGVVLY